MSNVLVIGDIHEPVSHPRYLDFVRDTQDEYQCDKVVFIGDVVDWHGISFHARHPHAPGVKAEYELALEKVALWCAAFPKATVLIGNHDERVTRLASSVNIPEELLLGYAKAWNTPKWDWRFDYRHDGVYYLHGTGCSGLHPAYNLMRARSESVVIGHVHTAFGTKWMANGKQRFFGTDTGCGVDEQSVAMAYGKHFQRKSVLGCAVVLDGDGQSVIMKCSAGEKYNRKKRP